MSKLALQPMDIMLFLPIVMVSCAFAIQKMKKPEFAIQKYIFYFASLIYCISLSLPVWSVKGHKAIIGYETLAIGWLGLITLDPRWFCNAIILVAWINVFEKYHQKTAAYCFILALIGTTAIFGPYHAGLSMGTFELFEGAGLTWGGYLWIFSLWLFAISAYIKNEDAATPASKSK